MLNELESFEKFRIFKTKPSSYIGEILRLQGDITLVHSKDNLQAKTDESFTSRCDDPGLLHDSTNLDLTGNPLLVDLKEDDDLERSVNLISRPNNWTESERHHFPIDIGTARKVLRTLNKHCSLSAGDHNLAPLKFCVCNGGDVNKAILLGSNCATNTRILVSPVGCFDRSHPSMDIESMKKKHVEVNCGFNGEVTSHVSATYSILGWNLRNCEKFSALSTSRSLLLETEWNQPVYDPENTRDNRLILQIVAGHVDLKFHPLWKELALIQMCLEKFDESDVDSVRICDDPMDYVDISTAITDLISKRMQRSLKHTKAVEFKNLDVQNLREEELMDQLWKLLINCDTAETLRDALMTIFEEFAQNMTMKYRVPEDNNSSIANILRGILEGSLAVPTIITSQALVFLIELGLQKLKNDYFHIIKGINTSQYIEISNQWNKIHVKVQNVDSRMTLMNSKIVSVSRKTRMTIPKGALKFELGGLTKQLDYLSGLHVAIEFVDLISNSVLHEDYYDNVTASVLERYRSHSNGLSTDNSAGSANLQLNRLCETVIDLHNLNGEFLKSLNQLSWNLRMTSTKRNSKVTTIFHHSTFPVIPPVIFKSWDIKTNKTEDKIYYVHEAVIYDN